MSLWIMRFVVRGTEKQIRPKPSNNLRWCEITMDSDMNCNYFSSQNKKKQFFNFKIRTFIIATLQLVTSHTKQWNLIVRISFIFSTQLNSNKKINSFMAAVQMNAGDDNQTPIQIKSILTKIFRFQEHFLIVAERRNKTFPFYFPKCSLTLRRL